MIDRLFDNILFTYVITVCMHMCVNVSIVHICTHKHTFCTFIVDISLKYSTNINIDCKLILNHSNLQLEMSKNFTVLPNKTFVLTDGSTILIGNDV